MTFNHNTLVRCFDTLDGSSNFVAFIPFQGSFILPQRSLHTVLSNLNSGKLSKMQLGSHRDLASGGFLHFLNRFVDFCPSVFPQCSRLMSC